MEKIVKIIACDSRYTEESYSFLPAYDDVKGAYLTGQHIDVSNHDTLQNLTVDEMTGKVTPNAQKLERFPYIINPLNIIKIKNGDTLNVTKAPDGSYINHRDIAVLNMLRFNSWLIAKDHSSVIPRKHKFYLKDDEHEATVRLSKSDMSYEAEKYVREELPEPSYTDLAVVLKYKIKGFDFDKDKTNKVILKDKLLSVCRNEPEKILEFKADVFKDDLFVLKLASYDIIRQRGTDFFDGKKCIGTSIDEVKKYIKQEQNHEDVSKWGKQLVDIEKPEVVLADPEKEERKKAMFDELVNYSFEELKRYAGQKRYPKVDVDPLDKDGLLKYIINKVK